MATKKFRVMRALDGDRLYAPGDVREMSAADAKQLVDLGALQPIEDAAADEVGAPDGKPEPDLQGKSEPEPLNKAEPAPLNKAERKTRRKAEEGEAGE